jgi:hypothetical protein
MGFAAGASRAADVCEEARPAIPRVNMAATAPVRTRARTGMLPPKMRALVGGAAIVNRELARAGGP